MCFDDIHLLSTLFKLPTFSLLTQLCVHFCFHSLSPICAAHVLLDMTFHWNMINRVTLLEKKKFCVFLFISLSSYQILTSPSHVTSCPPSLSLFGFGLPCYALKTLFPYIHPPCLILTPFLLDGP